MLFRSRESHFLHFLVLSQETCGFSERNLRGVAHGISVNTATDRREGQPADAVFQRQYETGAVTGGQQFRFTFGAAFPYRADGVDDMPGGQTVAARDLGLTGLAAAEGTARSCASPRPFATPNASRTSE